MVSSQILAHPPWLDALEDALFWLGEGGELREGGLQPLVLACNRSARLLMQPGVDVDRLPCALGEALSVGDPQVLSTLLRGESAGSFSLLTQQGALRVQGASFELAEGFSPTCQRATRVLVLRPIHGEEAARGAFGIVAFYSLLMHELKNPLAAVKMLVQGMEFELQAHTGAEANREMLLSYLVRANREVDRVVKRMDSVKYLSRLTLERHGRYELAPVVRSMLNICAPSLDKANVRSQAHLDENPIWVEGDADELRQLLLNLIDFALESMGERGGLLRITLKREHGRPLLQVTDTGSGWTEAELSALYARNDPFKSGSLGLSVARWIVERYHGSLTFVSQKGRGTTVEVRLPEAPSEPAEQR